MKNSKNNKRVGSNIMMLLAIAMFAAVSCSKIYDNVEKYVDGEIVYIDKLDGILKVQIGYERVEIDLLEAGRIPSSQIFMAKATKTVIECPDFTEPEHRRVIDSICSWVNVTGLTQLKYYELSIYTEDVYGNRSLPLKASVKPYTIENLNTIEITPPSISASSTSAQIEWIDGISAVTHQVVSFEWKFTDRDGLVIAYEEEGDNPVIFLENVVTETDIPVTLNCRIIPTISGSGSNYTPILDTVNFQKVLNFRLSANADDVIFLKSPAPGIDNDLTDNLPISFTWTKSDAVDAYTLKFSLLPNFPATGTYTVDVGDVNEYVMDNDEMNEVFDALKEGYSTELYWTVTPTEQSVPIKTSFRLLKLWKVGFYYPYDRSDWTFLEASSTLGGYPGIQAIDNNFNTFWHTSAAELPHWFVIDMKTPQSVFKFDVYRTSGGYSDTKSVELYLGNSPDALLFYSWTKVGAGSFQPTTTGTTEPYIEVLTTDNVTEGRYLKMHFLDGRSGSNPYVNVAELLVYHR